MDWVRCWDLDWDWDLDGVWLLDWPLDGDGPLDGGGDWAGHIDLVLVDAQGGVDLSPDGGDDGVGAAQTGDGLVDDGVSGGGSQVAGCWGDGSSGGGHGHSGHGDGVGHHLVGGWPFNDGVGWGLRHGLSGGVVLVSDLDGAGPGVDLTVSDHSVLDVGPGDGGSGVDVLLDVGGSGDDSAVGDSWGSYDSSGSWGSVDTGGMSDGGDGGSGSNANWCDRSCVVVGGGSRAQSSAASSQNLQQKTISCIYVVRNNS